MISIAVKLLFKTKIQNHDQNIYLIFKTDFKAPYLYTYLFTKMTKPL